MFNENRKQEESNLEQRVFNLEEELKRVKGPYIEIGGPTLCGYRAINTNELEKKMLVSNLFKGRPTFANRKEDGTINREIVLKEKVDFQANGIKMPVQDGKVGAIFFSELTMGKIDLKSKEDQKKLEIAKKKGGNEYINEIKKQGIELRKGVIKEAFRLLEGGGLLIFQGGEYKEECDFAQQIGFEKVQELINDSQKPSCSYVFKKPE